MFFVFILAIITALTVPFVHQAKKVVGAANHHPTNAAALTFDPTLAPTTAVLTSNVSHTHLIQQRSNQPKYPRTTQSSSRKVKFQFHSKRGYNSLKLKNIYKLQDILICFNSIRSYGTISIVLCCLRNSHR